MEVGKFLATLVVGLLIVVVLTRAWGPIERRIAAASLVVHAFSGIAQELVYRFLYERGGDMMLYQYYGRMLSRYLSFDLRRNIGDVLALLFQTTSTPLPFYVQGAGSSTGSMSALSGLVTHFWSNELYVIGAGVGVASTIGSLLLYKSIRPDVPGVLRNKAAVALCLLPSVVFWSSALLKESVIMFGVGLTTYSVRRLLVDRRFLTGAIGLCFGVLPIMLYKTYVLAGFFAALPPLILALRANRKGVALRVTPGRLALLAGLTFVFVVAFGQVFEQYDVSELGAELAHEQSNTLGAAGGSTYQLVDPGSTSLAQQLAFGPFAVATVFFRPFLFEAHNAQAAANALEATGLLVLFIVGWRRTGPRAFGRQLLSQPMLLFLAVFVCVIALGVGLATTNMGTLSRYRVPMYGQFALIVVLFAFGQRRGAPTTT